MNTHATGAKNYVGRNWKGKAFAKKAKLTRKEVKSSKRDHVSWKRDEVFSLDPEGYLMPKEDPIPNKLSKLMKVPSLTQSNT